MKIYIYGIAANIEREKKQFFTCLGPLLSESSPEILWQTDSCQFLVSLSALKKNTVKCEIVY